MTLTAHVGFTAGFFKSERRRSRSNSSNCIAAFAYNKLARFPKIDDQIKYG